MLGLQLSFLLTQLRDKLFLQSFVRGRHTIAGGRKA